MNFLQDLRHSLRTLRKTPAFTLTALISLAIGLGATTTVFTFINAFFLRPLPGIEDQGRLVNLHQSTAVDERPRRFSKPSYDDVRRAARHRHRRGELFPGPPGRQDRPDDRAADRVAQPWRCQRRIGFVRGRRAPPAPC